MITRSLLPGERALTRLLGIKRKEYEKMFGDFEVYVSDDVANRSFREVELLRNLNNEDVYQLFLIRKGANVGFVGSTDIAGIYQELADFSRRGGDFSELEIFVVPLKSEVRRREELAAWH